MDVERSSLCNCVVNFLLEENYLLTAFELLHELLEDGRDAHAIRLKEYFSDTSQFPPDQISRFNRLRVADPQCLLEEKEALEEKLAISQYELRLAQEDIERLRSNVQKQTEYHVHSRNGPVVSPIESERSTSHELTKDTIISDLGPLKDPERRDLNCAIKEYLLLAGYRLTVMTFCEEVMDQEQWGWQNSPGCVPDALRHYYYEYLSTTAEAAEEKIAILRERESLTKLNQILTAEKELLLKQKDVADGQITALTKSLEAVQKDLKDKESMVQSLKQSLDHQRKDLNECRSEITSLKMQIEGSRSSQGWLLRDSELVQPSDAEGHEAEIRSLRAEIEKLRGGHPTIVSVLDPQISTNGSKIDVGEVHSGDDVSSHCGSSEAVVSADNVVEKVKHEKLDHPESINLLSTDRISSIPSTEVDSKLQNNPDVQASKTESSQSEITYGKDFMTVQVLSDALPKIVPYVLINHREELLPLIMCAIERHPDSTTRDSLTHTLFNLIKRPDEQQRHIIMDACVSLAKNVGEVRTETELLPQCWEQINHMYEERRLLVAQSCGELAEFVRPEIRDSLILSIVQQLVEDPATVVREAAAHNLAMLLDLFPDVDKYFKVEELMFNLLCDPSGTVVETTLKELVPAALHWGNKLGHVLRVSLSHILCFIKRCPPLSGVESSVEPHLRLLGDRERWNIEVLLRLLIELIPFVHKEAIETCPFSQMTRPEHGPLFSVSLLELYARGHVDWPIFDWMHADCFPGLVEISCLLPGKEDNIRRQITKFLLAASELFGEAYSTNILLPIFLSAVGDDAQIMLPSAIERRILGLHPKNASARRFATMCVLPLFLAGILGAPSRKEELAEYLRKILVHSAASADSWLLHGTTELVEAVRFLCTFEEHHSVILNILWEMVVSASDGMKIGASHLLKVLVPYIDEKVASTHVLPALITLGSDQNLNVKYASIEAFGVVAQHFTNNTIIDKIRVQMDAFLEDGSHEAIVTVIHALVAAAPHTGERLREYLLVKIFQLSSVSSHGGDVVRRRERANAFCEAIRALDATDIPAATVRDHLLPAISNLLKDSDAVDPAHREALEIIVRERSGGTRETFGKVMGAHLGIATSVSSLFGESGLLGKKEYLDHQQEVLPSSPQAVISRSSQEDTRFRRIIRGNFGEMLRGRGKINDESSHNQSG